MESAGQYLQWHPTSHVGLYSYSRLRSLWDSVVGVCSSPMGLPGHLAWEDRKEQHENILPLRPPWSAAILSSCLPELNHSSACVHLWEEDIKKDRGFVCVTPKTQTCSVSAPWGAPTHGPQTVALTVQTARGSQNLISDTITTAGAQRLYSWVPHSCCSSIHPTQLPWRPLLQTALAIHLSAPPFPDNVHFSL